MQEMLAHCVRGRDMVIDALDSIDRVMAPPVPASFYSFFRIEGVTDQGHCVFGGWLRELRFRG